jgi:transposase InsO family protein
MKRRNPRMGSRKIAEQISNAFGLEINKDVVRRILIQHYRPAPGGAGPSWLSVIGQTKDSLWSVDLFRCESILPRCYWVMVVMDVFTRRIAGFGVAAANLDGPRAITRQRMPKYLSSDHDPLFLFQPWLANLRILEVDEIKSIPSTPRSHAFIERLIGTILREYLDQTLFWNQGDLERKLDWYKKLLQPISQPHRTGRNHSGSAQWRSCASYRKPSLIPLARTLQRPLSDPRPSLSCISPHTGDITHMSRGNPGDLAAQ